MNIPDGHGDESGRFYNRAFQAKCALQTDSRQGTLPRSAFIYITLAHRPQQYRSLPALRPPSRKAFVPTTLITQALCPLTTHLPAPDFVRHADAGVEWPTWLLCLAIYGGWLGALYWYGQDASAGALVLIVVMGAWYMSLQHELVHGHPTRHAWLNRALGLLPIAVWYPFDIYRSSHLAHHRDEVLTYPGQDPESNYLEPQDFASRSAAMRFVLQAQRTAVGRFAITPAFAVFHLLRPLLSAAYWHSARVRWTWLQHATLLGLMLWAIQRYAGISPWLYLSLSYACLGLAFMRSFYEHRPAAEPQHRIVINEAGWLWRLLFLNNNYHAVHHAQPKLAWYRIPALYQSHRDYFLERNGGYLLRGYVRFFTRYAMRPLDTPGQQTRDLDADYRHLA